MDAVINKILDSIYQSLFPKSYKSKHHESKNQTTKPRHRH